ncbi:MAG: nucleotidyltransferase domain-containing protein [Candidatus Sumerlaeota bacterium]|nr:nucleotidyltransferase domain-containing protein [Candidatus Sumerlaeota bacterium]
MDKAAVLSVLARFRKALEKQGVNDARLILFGSQAKGTAREDSDIDLIIISVSFEGKTFWERIQLTSKAICEVFEPIEAIAMTPSEWESGESIIAEYARDGEVIAA